MSILKYNSTPKAISLEKVDSPQLYRDLFPYSNICRINFDDVMHFPRPADPMFITDTTFRDGQQSRPPYGVHQIARLYDLMHKLGGKSGLIQATEFFMYSEKDRKAIEVCRARGYRFPRITGWIRANSKDLELARSMEFSEVGMLTSVSDYHIFLKLGKTREQAMEDYLKVINQALEWGIVPRCHFEDITRADIYGFCIPFAQKLMELSKQSSMPIKIRLCDTMGYGVPYQGAALPRSVQRIVRAFIDEGGVPGEWLEWHGHNDFHKVLVNGVTAWLHGCAAVNGSFLGIGERTGNTPLEGLIIEYISLTGDDTAADTSVISEVADFFENELDYQIPGNYPFVGKDFNATRAGVHVDGLAKNEEIYNIFDTTALLGRPVPIIITDKSGRAGVAYWINNTFKLTDDKVISKKHPVVGKIYDDIMQAYEKGRTISFSNKEMNALVQRYMPELFITQFDRMKELGKKLAAHLVERLVQDPRLHQSQEAQQECMDEFVHKYPFIQFLYSVDTQGLLKCAAIIDPVYQERYKSLPIGYDFSNREWFQVPMKTGKLHTMDVYQSHFTQRLLITVSCAVTNDKDEILGVVGADMQLEELLRREEMLKDDQINDPEDWYDVN